MRAQWRRLTPANRKLITCKLPLGTRHSACGTLWIISTRSQNSRRKSTSQLSSRRLPAEIRDRHGEIDWVAVAAADNVYRHEYETVDETLIWHTVRRVSPPCEVWPLQN